MIIAKRLFNVLNMIKYIVWIILKIYCLNNIKKYIDLIIMKNIVWMIMKNILCFI